MIKRHLSESAMKEIMNSLRLVHDGKEVVRWKHAIRLVVDAQNKWKFLEETLSNLKFDFIYNKENCHEN